MDKCPKDYLRWTFVVVGMVFAFVCYLVYANVTGSLPNFSADMASEFAPAVVREAIVQTGGQQASTLPREAENVILTEHVNEDDDYEKPVCKRLEESGSRYNDDY